MKSSLDHLPESKRRELGFVVETIREGFAFAIARRTMPRLRGVRLLGINSGESSNDVRETVWRRLATDMKPPLLKEMARTVPLSKLPPVFDDFINAKVTRRVVVDLAE